MGVISNIKEFRQRNDGIGVTFDLEDWDGLASCIVFAQHYKQVQKYIKDGNVIKVYGYFNKQDEESFSNELIARQILPWQMKSIFIMFLYLLKSSYSLIFKGFLQLSFFL